MGLLRLHAFSFRVPLATAAALDPTVTTTAEGAAKTDTLFPLVFLYFAVAGFI